MDLLLQERSEVLPLQFTQKPERIKQMRSQFDQGQRSARWRDLRYCEDILLFSSLLCLKDEQTAFWSGQILNEIIKEEFYPSEYV